MSFLLQYSDSAEDRFLRRLDELATAPDWSRFQQIQAYCSRNEHAAEYPRLLFAEDTPNRGRWLVEVRDHL